MSIGVSCSYCGASDIRPISIGYETGRCGDFVSFEIACLGCRQVDLPMMPAEAFFRSLGYEVIE